MSSCSYGFVKQVPGAKLGDVRPRVEALLKEQGFGVLTEIDVKATLKKKLDVDFRPYLILGACNPNLAHRAISAESQIGLLLPCNVVLQEEHGGVTVSIIDPRAMFTMVKHPELESVAAEAEERLRRVIDGL